MPERIANWFAGLTHSRGDASWVGSLAVSMAGHVGLLIVLAVWLIAPQLGDDRVAALGDWANVEDAVVDLQEPIQQKSDDDPNDSGATPSSVIIARSQPLQTKSVREPQEALPFLTSATDDPEFAKALSERITPFTGKGNGLGDGSGIGGGGRKTPGFFGNTAIGKTYVYVVDASRSMHHPHDGEFKTRMKRLKAELVRSVGTLSPENRFFIIFFDDEPRPMPARQMQRALPHLQQRYLKWAVEEKPHGGTQPVLALRLALKMEPDVIFFLTDGEFEYKTRSILKNIRQSRTAIHTFALGNPRAEKELRRFAAANGGKYQFVP